SAGHQNLCGITGECNINDDYDGDVCERVEHLATEVIQVLPYSKEIDWWSFGTMLHEMLSPC
ncbi:hypothetical protein BT96DRAFT_1049066, partial [Gymnopus androsaceus JB14]